MTSQNFSKQIPKNLAINILSFLATVVIGLWLTPYLLKHLGIVAYGLIPLAMFLSQYVSVIINAINMSINRFLLIALQKKQDKDANEIFNTALVIILAFIILQALVMGVILFDITQFFTIPQDLIVDATWLFGLTFVGFSISLFRSVFGTSMFAYNRLDILRIIDIVQNLVRVISIVILFTYDAPSLKYIGMANFLAALSAVVPTLYYFKKFTPQLKVKVASFSKHRVSELSKMSTWVLINQVGVLLLTNIDLYLVNNWIGIQATGEYAIIVQVINLFTTIVGLFGGVFAPVIMILYANKEHEKLKKLLIIAAKIMIIFMSVPLALIIYFSGDLISIWLGEELRHLESLLSFSLLFLVFSVSVTPLYSVNIAYNKVKLPSQVTILIGVINILGIYFLLHYTKLELWAVILVKLILVTLYSVLFMPIYASVVTGASRGYFLKIPIVALFSFVLIYSLIYYISFLVNIKSLFEIVLLSVILIVLMVPLQFFIFFTKDEQYFLFKKFIKK